MARVITFDEFGGPEVLHMTDQQIAPTGAGEVRVRIQAFAVNPLDLMMRSGTSPAPVALPGARLGIEATGVVDAVGEEVALEPGTGVILTAVPDASVNGCYAEFVTVPAERLIVRPKELEIAEGAAIWVGFSTAYGALVEKARMRPGDVVAVNAASGAVGRAAIQVANHLGAVPIAVTRGAAKRDQLLAAGAAHVVVTDTEDVTTALLQHTAGTGVDLVLDLVTGPGQGELARGIRRGGTLVCAGFLDPRPAPMPTAPITVHRYMGFEHTLDAAVVRRMAAAMSAGVRLGVVRPIVGATFSLDEVAEAHRHVESGRATGKTVVIV